MGWIGRDLQRGLDVDLGVNLTSCNELTNTACL